MFSITSHGEWSVAPFLLACTALRAKKSKWYWWRYAQCWRKNDWRVARTNRLFDYHGLARQNPLNKLNFSLKHFLYHSRNFISCVFFFAPFCEKHAFWNTISTQCWEKWKVVSISNEKCLQFFFLFFVS